MIKYDLHFPISRCVFCVLCFITLIVSPKAILFTRMLNERTSSSNNLSAWFTNFYNGAGCPSFKTQSNPEVENAMQDETDLIQSKRRRQTIGSPYGIKHDLHIRYNFTHARFEGEPSLDPVWNELVNQQFNLPYTKIPRIALVGYEERIPAVLVMLKQHLFSQNGHLTPHIFRESPKKGDRDLAIELINKGQFNGCADVRIIADLIKVWLRELPTPILWQIPLGLLSTMVVQGKDNFLEQLNEKLGSVERSLLFWLSDLLVEIAEHESVNHMGIKQLAIVLAPNLIRIETNNPMAAVTSSKGTVEFLYHVLEHRKNLFKASSC